jgi:hypothetical protein
VARTLKPMLPGFLKVKLRPLGSHRNAFGGPAALAMLQTIVFEARKQLLSAPPDGKGKTAPTLKRGRLDRGWGNSKAMKAPRRKCS